MSHSHIRYSLNQREPEKEYKIKQEEEKDEEKQRENKSMQIPNNTAQIMSNLDSNKKIKSNALNTQLNFLKPSLIRQQSNHKHNKYQSSNHLNENTRYDQIDKTNNNIKNDNQDEELFEEARSKHDESVKSDKDINDDELKRLKNITNPFDSIKGGGHLNIKHNYAYVINYEISPLKTCRETIHVLQQKNNLYIINGITPNNPIRTNSKKLNCALDDNDTHIEPIANLIENKSESSNFIIQYAENNNNHQENNKDNQSQSNDMRDIHIQISDNPIHKEKLIQTSIRFSSITKRNLKQIPDLVYQYRSNPSKESKEEIKRKKQLIVNDNFFSSCSLFDISELPEQTEKETFIKHQWKNDDINQLSKEMENNLDNYCISDTYILSYCVGKATSISKLKHYYTSENNSSYTISMNSLEKEINLSRTIYSDGDGFFRAIAFSIIENYIQLNSFEDIEHLAYCIYKTQNKVFNYNDTLFNKEIILGILNILINSLTQKKIVKAYQIFINAFIFFPLFQFGLIKFIKILIAKYIESYHILFDDYIIQKNIVSNDYIENNTFLSNKYINNEILCMNHEPDHLIISIIPKVLGVNLIFYYLEPNDLVKHILIGNNSLSLTESSYLRIILSCARYEIGYCTKEYFNSFKYYYTQIDHFPLSSLKIFRDQVICNICSKTTTEIVLDNNKGYPMCRFCLIDAIKNTMINRVAFLIGDYYNNKEFYSQPIPLSKERNQFLYDEDVLLLIGMTLPQYLRTLIPVKCESCDMLLELQEEKIQLGCGCYYCRTCLRNKVMIDTNHRIVLNPFEKMREQYKKNKPKCKCNAVYDSSAVIKNIFSQELQQYKTKANERFQLSMQHICCICSNETTNKCYFPIYSSINESFDCLHGTNAKKILLTHIVCIKCKAIYDQKKKEKKHQKLLHQSSSSNANPKFNCIFCNESHEFATKNNEETDKSKGCLSNCCIVY